MLSAAQSTNNPENNNLENNNLEYNNLLNKINTLFNKLNKLNEMNEVNVNNKLEEVDNINTVITSNKREIEEFLNLIERAAKKRKNKLVIVPHNKIFSNIEPLMSCDDYLQFTKKFPFSNYYFNSYESYCRNYEYDLKDKYRRAYYLKKQNNNVLDYEIINVDNKDIRFIGNCNKYIDIILSNNPEFKTYDLYIKQNRPQLLSLLFNPKKIPSFIKSFIDDKTYEEKVGFVIEW